MALQSSSFRWATSTIRSLAHSFVEGLSPLPSDPTIYSTAQLKGIQNVMASPFNPTFGLDASATTLEAARANILASSKSQVAALNADEIVRYHGAMNGYNLALDAGKISSNPNSPVGNPPYQKPPDVPMAWELDDPTAEGFVFYRPGTTPVCAAVALDPDRSQTQAQLLNALPKSVIDVGKHLQGAWYSLGPTDTFDVGKTTPPIPDADGNLHTYQKFGGFAPGTGWYLQLT